MEYIQIRKIINLEDIHSKFLVSLNRIEKKHQGIHRIIKNDSELKMDILRLIINHLGIDIIELIINRTRYDFHKVISYLQALEYNEFILDFGYYILQPMNLNDTQKILLKDFFVMLATGEIRNNPILGRKISTKAQKQLVKFYGNRIIKYIVNDLKKWQKIDQKTVFEYKKKIIKSVFYRAYIRNKFKSGSDIHLKASSNKKLKNQSYIEEFNKSNKKYKYPLIASLGNSILLQMAVKENNYKVARNLIKKGVLKYLTAEEKVWLLMLAINYQNLNMVKMIVKNGVNIRLQPPENQVTILFYSLIKDFRIFHLLINFQSNLNAQDENGESILIKAIAIEDTRAIKLLLSKGVDYNIESKYNETAIICAVRKGRKDIVKLLLKAGADLHQLNMRRESALMEAIKCQQDHIVQYIINNSWDLKLESWYGSLVLITAVEYSSVKMTKLLLKKGVNPNIKICNSCYTLIGKAVKSCIEFKVNKKVDTEELKLYSPISVLKLLLQYGANLGLTFFSHAPLTIAIEAGDLECIELLLKYGEALSKEWLGKYSVKIMKKPQNEKMIQIFEHYILKQALNINSQKCLKNRLQSYLGKVVSDIGAEDCIKHGGISEMSDYIIARTKIKKLKTLLKTGSIPDVYELMLNIAVAQGNLELSKKLLLKGANPNFIQDGIIESPLYQAVESHHGNKSQLIKLILKSGADPNFCEKRGNSLLIMCPKYIKFKRYNKDILSLLLEHGVKVNMKYYLLGITETTPLIEAVANARYEEVKLFLEHGADVNIAGGTKCNTPLIYAIEDNDYRNAKILLQYGSNLNVVNQDNDTALSISIKRAMENITRLILESNNINTLNGEDLAKGVLWAVERGYSSIVSRLVKQRSFKDIPNYILKKNIKFNHIKYSPTCILQKALLVSVDLGNLESAKILLEAGVSPFFKDQDGNTLLHKAAMKGYIKIFEVLLLYGLGVEIRNNEGTTVLEALDWSTSSYITYLLRNKMNTHKILGSYSNIIKPNTKQYYHYCNQGVIN